MNRDKATKILSRILETIDQGRVPARIREVYVFGSYARGALEPNDIDLVVVHDHMPGDLRSQLEQRARKVARDFMQQLFYPDVRFKGMITRALRKPGEAVDMLLGNSLEAIIRTHSPVKKSARMLLWSTKNRNWQAALASIRPDPNAGRTERHQFISPKVAGCSLLDVDHITDLLDRKELTLTRMELEQGQPVLKKKLADRYRYWIEFKMMGRKSLECLPFALGWLQTEGARDFMDGRGLWAHNWKVVITIGNLSPDNILYRFQTNSKLKKQAHILHFNRSRPREILVFERGPNWDPKTV